MSHSISADGRFIAFRSAASDLAPDTPPGSNVFLHDRLLGTNTLLSRRTGTRQDVLVDAPILNGDGRFIAFGSIAPDLVPGQIDDNGWTDAFLFDRLAGTLALMSHTANPLECGDRASRPVAIAEDGSTVLVASAARNLVVMEDDPFGGEDLFVHRVSTKSNTLVSHRPGKPSVAAGASLVDRTSMSEDGAVIAFGALDPGFFYQLRTWVHETDRNDVRPLSYSGYVENPTVNTDFGNLTVSGDGRLVAFTSTASNLGVGIRDFDSGWTLYGWDRSSSAFEPLSRAAVPSTAALVRAEARVSRNGRVVAFEPESSNAFTDPLAEDAVGVALLDRDTGRTELASWSLSRNVAAPAYLRALSGDGSTVFFQSRGTVGDGLVVPDGFAWFAYERASGAISLVSRSANPRVAAQERVFLGGVTLDGRFATLDTKGEDLGADVPSNGRVQVYRWSRDSGAITLVSRDETGSAGGNGDSHTSRISADGSTIAFVSTATNLAGAQVPGNGKPQVFLQDTATGAIRLVSRDGSGAPGGAASGLGYRSVLSDDGRYLLFHSKAEGIGGLENPLGFENVYRFDRETSEIILVSHEPGRPRAGARAKCMEEELSADGRRVAYLTRAENIVPTGNRLQVVLWEADWPAARLLSRRANGAPASEDCSFPALSADGSTVAFGACGPDLLPEEASGRAQIFVYDSRSDRLLLASHGGSPVESGNDSSWGSVEIDASGGSVLFRSGATNLGTGLGATDLLAWGFPSDDRLGLFVFSPPPFLLASTPSCASSAGGRMVRVQGAHFQPGATVTLDGIAAQVGSVSPTEIVATAGARAPGPAHTGHVIVTNPNGEYFALGNAFTYAVRGDANNSGALTAADGFSLAQAVFLGGPQPASLCNGDANGSGAITSADSFFLNLYLFLG
ncbi:MAG: PD40 domain-containing protein, partial [Acidobacteria bacterium]|nr:PD40 domain-containing protein [Acidobacteriota bacterium]